MVTSYIQSILDANKRFINGNTEPVPADFRKEFTAILNRISPEPLDKFIEPLTDNEVLTLYGMLENKITERTSATILGFFIGYYLRHQQTAS